jgi:hypothetical protein
MSVHVEPSSIEEVLQGATTVVNGRTFSGPITVFKNSRIVEVSFTATGWDANTSAVAMSRGGDNPEGNDMDLKQAIERVAALEAENKALQASNVELTKKFSEATDTLTKTAAAARTSAVTQLFADIGREYKAEDVEAKAFSAMPQEAFDATAKVLREQFKRPTHPAGLFQHQATAGAQTPAPQVNPLMADAEKRATQFGKRAAH